MSTDKHSLMRSVANTPGPGRAWQLVVAAAVFLVMAAAGTVGPGTGFAAGKATCTSAEKSQYQAAAAAYAKRMLKDRARYFKAHKSAKLRAAFVKTQKAKLKALRLKASCDDSTPPEPAPPPIDLNPSPSANETFTFGPGMSGGTEELIKGDIAFANEDENRLVGLSLAKVTVFASTDANWLASKQCGFYGYGGNCVSDTASFYASGNSAAQGGPGAVFLYWASSAWQYGAAPNQKIIAHELFHVLQYQTDHLIHAGETPSDQVRPTGPVWLDEGAPEMIGFRVMADRRLSSYASALDNQIAVTKQISTPLNQLERLSQTNVPNVYSLFALSVDHLVKVTPAGAPALATYYRALGAGAAWPDAFKQAFGMSVADYHANFADYRSKL
jgi:hypothetical protein